MSFDRKFYEAAELEMNSRRNRAERLLDASEYELKNKHPEIYRLSRALKSTSAKILLLISERLPKEEFEVKWAEIENENLSLQEEMRRSLVRAGYPADFLELHYTCGICKDSGVVDGRRCSCFMEVVKRLAAEEMNRNTPMQLCNFSDFDLNFYDSIKPVQPFGVSAREIMEQNLGICKAYADNFHLPTDDMGLLMRGGTGLGKTHLSLSIASVVIAKGYNVIYGSAPDFLRKAEQEHFGRAEGNTMERLLEADLLVFDDLGAEFENKFSLSAVYNIINNRFNAGLPIIVSTNLTYNELLGRYGERITSRLNTLSDLFFAGNDVRIAKKMMKR